MAGKAGPQGGLALLEGMHAIEHTFTVPVAVFVQPLSGLALIFVAGYSASFGQNKRVARMIEIAKAGPPTPEFIATAKTVGQTGPIITVLLVAIIVLMVTKPGG